MNEQRWDKLEERLLSIDKTLVRQEENLREHMRRSLANEQAIEAMRAELSPIKTHVAVVGGIGKWLIGGGLAGLIGLAVKLIQR